MKKINWNWVRRLRFHYRSMFRQRTMISRGGVRAVSWPKCLALFVFLIIFVFSSCSSAKNAMDTQAVFNNVEKPIAQATTVSKETKDNTSQRGSVFADDVGITRAMVAKMIALARNDLASITVADREIDFKDTDPTQWYDKYINVAKAQGAMVGSKDTFQPEALLTMEQAQSLLDTLDENNTLKMKITDENKNKPISYALWTQLFESMLQNKNGGKSLKEGYDLTEKKIIVLATPQNNKNLTGWNIITDIGPFSFEGMDVSALIDQEATVLVKDGEILCVTEIVDITPTIKNAFIVGCDSDKMTIFSGGVERTYTYTGGDAAVAGLIGDIQIDAGTALKVQIYDEKISDTIKSVDQGQIELESLGLIQLTPDTKIYSVVSGKVKWKSIGDLTVGTQIAYYILRDGQIGAAIITKTSAPDTIRVAISTTDFKSLSHPAVEVSATEAYEIIAGSDVKKMNAADVFTVSSTENKDLFGNNRITIRTESGNGKIRINSIQRNWPDKKAPLYRGTIEIAKGEQGYTVVNEVGMEEYLYAVVPSEMPTSYGVEAAKVQAVAARSYAFNQYYANKYHRYGANIDDSVSSQVYNNIPENDTSIQAVNDTKGLCITYDGGVVSTNFFSTSSGVTANSGEVWANAKQFPTETSPYLVSTKQYQGKDYGDLTIEENMSAFLKDIAVKSFDQEGSWFRWNIAFSAKAFSGTINKNLKERYEANPTLVKTLDPDGTYRSKPIQSVGDVLDVQVVKRGEGGNVMVLKIVGTKATIMVYTEYTIRMLIKPQGSDETDSIVINRGDGTELRSYSMLPSAFIVFEKEQGADGKLSAIKIYGGGNGHGVGMSQSGVKGMIDAGYDFEGILKHYFSGTEIEKMLG